MIRTATDTAVVSRSLSDTTWVATHTLALEGSPAQSPVCTGTVLFVATTVKAPAMPKKFTSTGSEAFRSTLLSLVARLSQATVMVSPSWNRSSAS